MGRILARQLCIICVISLTAATVSAYEKGPNTSDAAKMGAETMKESKATIIRLPWHIYRHYPADFSKWDAAAAGFKGWDAEVRDLDVSRCCLALRHFPDRGLTPDT